LKNFKDFKLNYYVQHRNNKITKYISKDTILYGMINLVGVFWGPDDHKIPTGFIEVCSLGARKVIFGGLDTN